MTDVVIMQVAGDLGYFGGGNRRHKSLDAYKLLRHLGKATDGINDKESLEKSLRGTDYDGAFISQAPGGKLYVLECNFDKGGAGQEESVIDGLVDSGVTGKRYHKEWNKILGDYCRHICQTIRGRLTKSGKSVSEMNTTMQGVENDILRLQAMKGGNVGRIDDTKLRHIIIDSNAMEDLGKIYYQFKIPGTESCFLHHSFGPQCNKDSQKPSFRVFFDERASNAPNIVGQRVKIAQGNLLKKALEAKSLGNVTVLPTYISSDIFAPQTEAAKAAHVNAVKKASDEVNDQMKSQGINIKKTGSIQKQIPEIIARERDVILEQIFSYDMTPEIDGEFVHSKKTRFEYVKDINGFTYRGVFKVSPCDGGKLKVRAENAASLGSLPDGVDGGAMRKEMMLWLSEQIKNKGGRKVKMHVVGDNSSIEIELDSFFPEFPICKLHKFMQKIKSDNKELTKFTDWVFEVATNLDNYISGDKLKCAESVRKESCKSYEKGSGVYKYRKKDGYEGGKITDESLRHKRVVNPNFPWWISIDVVTGEFVIRAREDQMYIQDYTVPYIKDIRKLLQRDSRFKDILSEDKKDKDFFYEANGLYFTQNSFNSLKSLEKSRSDVLGDAEMQKNKSAVISENKKGVSTPLVRGKDVEERQVPERVVKVPQQRSFRENQPKVQKGQRNLSKPLTEQVVSVPLVQEKDMERKKFPERKITMHQTSQQSYVLFAASMLFLSFTIVGGVLGVLWLGVSSVLLGVACFTGGCINAARNNASDSFLMQDVAQESSYLRSNAESCRLDNDLVRGKHTGVEIERRSIGHNGSYFL